MKEISELENLLNKLDEVEESFEEVEEKQDKIMDRETEIVKKLFDRYSKIIRYIGDKAPVSYSHSGKQGASSIKDRENKNSLPIGRVEERGTDTYTKEGAGVPNRHKDGMNDTKGDYRGTIYRLYQDGELKKIKYSGEWSNWQGESSWYDAQIKEANIREIIKHFDLEEIIEVLKDKTNEAIKENKNKQKYTGKRLKTIEALEKVLDL